MQKFITATPIPYPTQPDAPKRRRGRPPAQEGGFSEWARCPNHPGRSVPFDPARGVIYCARCGGEREVEALPAPNARLR